MKHKYYDVIMAYANGQPIQYRYDVKWHDVAEGESPNFETEDVDWRIKQESLFIKYRLALMTVVSQNHYEEYYTAVFNDNEDGLIENSEGFVKWISPWLEYEVSNE